MSLRRCTTGLTSLPAVLCSNFKSASAACPIAQHFVFQPFHFLLPCFAFVSTAVRMLPLCGPKAFWKGQLERYPEVVNDGGFFVLFLSCLETLCVVFYWPACENVLGGCCKYHGFSTASFASVC